MKKIAVIGAGYVGLVTGACFAQQKDNFVIMVESNNNKIKALLAGNVPFYEPGLDALVEQGIKHEKLVFVNTIQQALEQKPEIIFSCVGTPPLPNGSADLSFVWTVAHEIGAHINDYCLIVNKSTVPIGTGKKVHNLITQKLTERNVYIDFDIVSNPEFLKEGDALNDFIKPDRIIIGTESERAFTLLKDLYKPFITHEQQIVLMGLESAELTKYAANALLATKISFINQIAQLADAVGANIEHVKLGISKDVRLGPHFLNAGIGFGGSCFPKDVSALVAMGQEHNVPMPLIKQVEDVNINQRSWFFEKIINYYGPQLSTKKVGIWGLSFKPETDDIRCAPSIDIINNLIKHKAHITVYDPVATENIKNLFGETLSYASTAEEILHACDCLVILTEWKEFTRFLPTHFLRLTDKIIFDGRNCLNQQEITSAGITYVCVGKNNIHHTIPNKHYTHVINIKEKQNAPHV
jgi:UDPglucose 6-dehydrogenase